MKKYSPWARVTIAFVVASAGVINCGFAAYGFGKLMGWI
jgi:hypothetical protein